MKLSTEELAVIKAILQNVEEAMEIDETLSSAEEVNYSDGGRFLLMLSTTEMQLLQATISKL